MRAYLDFEKPVAELEAKIDELRAVDMSKSGDLTDEIERLEASHGHWDVIFLG